MPACHKPMTQIGDAGYGINKEPPSRLTRIIRVSKFGSGETIVSLKERLNELLAEHRFLWMEIANNEGLSICEAGAEELPELAARLPGFLESGDKIARAAKLGHGMGFMVLMPKKGSFALLMRSFEVRQESFMLVVGTARLPKRAKRVLESICEDVSRYF